MLDGTNTRLVTDVTCRGHLVTCPYLYFSGERKRGDAAGSDRIFKRLKKEKRQMGCWDFFFSEKAYHRCHHHYCRGNKRRPANKDRDRVTASIISDKSFCLLLLLGFTFTAWSFQVQSGLISSDYASLGLK